jgi:hypothetical protein
MSPETAMCEKCKELDLKIEHFRSLSSVVTDRMTLDGIDALIAKCEAEKKTLHPDEPEAGGLKLPS